MWLQTPCRQLSAVCRTSSTLFCFSCFMRLFSTAMSDAAMRNQGRGQLTSRGEPTVGPVPPRAAASTGTASRGAEHVELDSDHVHWKRDRTRPWVCKGEPGKLAPLGASSSDEAATAKRGLARRRTDREMGVRMNVRSALLQRGSLCGRAPHVKQGSLCVMLRSA